MKRIICKTFLIPIIAVFTLISCDDSGDKTIDQVFDDVTRGAVFRSVSSQSATFNLFDNSSVWSRTFEVEDHESGDLLQEVDIFVAFDDQTPNNGKGADVPEEFLKTIEKSTFTDNANGLPQTTVEISLQEVSTALGVSSAQFDGTDQFTIRFALKLTDGRVFSNNNLNATVSGGSFFRSPFFYRATLVCPSDIGGTHSFVSTNLQAITGTCPTDPVTGTVTWEDLGGGIYRTSDLGFGQYGSSCWSDNPATSAGARIIEACGKVSTAGGDQYGLVYTYTITNINGAELTIDWFNDYGDSGTVVLTKEGGENWPTNLFTN